MLTVDISLPEIEELQKLVTEGVEKGFLSYDEIVAGLEEVDLTKEQVEDFYTYLIDHGVELMEGETHKSPPLPISPGLRSRLVEPWRSMTDEQLGTRWVIYLLRKD